MKLFSPLNGFEWITNIVLTLNVLLVVFAGGDKFIFPVLIFFILYIFPFDLGSALTIFSVKITNLLWHSLILLTIYYYRDKFESKNIVVWFYIVPFVYFNLMRVIGHAYIGNDPIWDRSRAGIYSNTKKRAKTSADITWSWIYFIFTAIIGVLFLNREHLF